MWPPRWHWQATHSRTDASAIRGLGGEIRRVFVQQAQLLENCSMPPVFRSVPMPGPVTVTMPASDSSGHRLPALAAVTPDVTR